MPRKIPDNAADGLEDILQSCRKSRRYWTEAQKKAEQLGDIVIILQLSRLRDELAEIERKARDARQNIYQP